MIAKLTQLFATHLQGILLCTLTAFAAHQLASSYQAPVMLFALLLGLAFHTFHQSEKPAIGINFCASTLLRLAIALLGVRIIFSDIMSLGVLPPLIVIASMMLTIIFGMGLARLLGLPKTFGVLTGGSVAICGVSAAAAISSVLPKEKDHDKFFALTVICITTLSTFAMIFYPMVVDNLQLSDAMAGVFLGGSIHDVAQVVGAGYSVSSEVGDIATYIKLMRVALLMPIVMIIFLSFKGRNNSAPKRAFAFIPPFLIAFIVIAVITNLGIIPTTIVNLLSDLSKALLVIAMTAIGMKTSLGDVFSVGWKPIVLLTTETVFFGGLILCGVMFI